MEAGLVGASIGGTELERRQVKDEAPRVRRLVVRREKPSFKIDDQTYRKLFNMHRLSEDASKGAQSAHTSDGVAADASWRVLGLDDARGPSQASQPGSMASGPAASGLAPPARNERSQASAFIPLPGCTPAELKKEWATMNGFQRIAVIRAVSARDYALIRGKPRRTLLRRLFASPFLRSSL